MTQHPIIIRHYSLGSPKSGIAVQGQCRIIKQCLKKKLKKKNCHLTQQVHVADLALLHDTERNNALVLRQIHANNVGAQPESFEHLPAIISLSLLDDRTPIVLFSTPSLPE